MVGEGGGGAVDALEGVVGDLDHGPVDETGAATGGGGGPCLHSYN